MNIVILAGGVGTRLWPLARKNSAKQFFPIMSEEPMVLQTYNRFVKVYKKEKIFFSTTKDLLPQLKKLFPKIAASQFIVEPSRRDTAGAMGFVAAKLYLKDPDEPMVFVPADHYIENQEKFLACFKVGEEIVKRTGKMVDIGVVADFPSTVLGYTKIGKLIKDYQGTKVYEFRGHTEKPDFKTATKYLAAGSYLWHGNYYMWTPRKFLETLEKNALAIYNVLIQIQSAFKKGSKDISKLYATIEKTSFDYAVTEKINKNQVCIIKGDFGWSDIGAWDVLHNQFKHTGDEYGNVKKGTVVYHNAKNSLVFGSPKKLIGIVGLEDIVVIDTKDALLVCHKDKAQDVKKLIAEIERGGMAKYL